MKHDDDDELMIMSIRVYGDVRRIEILKSKSQTDSERVSEILLK